MSELNYCDMCDQMTDHPLPGCSGKPASSLAASALLADWQQREAQVLGVLMDGHPNSEGYMEWWYAQNPKPN